MALIPGGLIPAVGRIIKGVLGGAPKISVALPSQQPTSGAWGLPGGWGVPAGYGMPAYQPAPASSAGGLGSDTLLLLALAAVVLFLVLRK
jgi:hypothetical protein